MNEISAAFTSRIVLISGLSGSGKSIALRLLEDVGFYCIDNLPLTLLAPSVQALEQEGQQQIAISIDARNTQELSTLPGALDRLREAGREVRLIFLTASDEMLMRRFSETRRRHPLSVRDTERTVRECIQAERSLLDPVRDAAHSIDTSTLSAHDLRERIRQFFALREARFTLIFQSFGFKHGLPLDVDFVFDARCLTNPYYDPALRAQDGRDPDIDAFLRTHSEAPLLLAYVADFLERWLPSFTHDDRSYLTVAVGCTGGQHRSVWLVEQLAAHFRQHHRIVLIRHRELADAAEKK